MADNTPEKRIQEQRTIEATKKNLMGFAGKLGCIAKNLGHPIIAEYFGGKYFASNEMPDYMNLDDDVYKDETIGEIVRKMRTVQIRIDGTPISEPGDVDPNWTQKHDKEDASTEQTGWYFDGLSRGMHLEIKCSVEEGSIAAYFKGYKVYEELAGELLAYNPNGGWEDCVNKLFEFAKNKEIQQKKIDKKESQDSSKKDKESWLQSLRDRWGF